MREPDPETDEDFTTEPFPERLERPATIPYDPEPRRESVRGWLAGVLIGLVGFEIVAGFALVAFGIELASVRALLEVLFPPSVALAGSVTGFYFAARPGPADSRP